MDLKAAHEHSSNNKEELSLSKVCGCFYCRTIFQFNLPVEGLLEWWPKKGKGMTTAKCPVCGIDSLIGDASGFPITPEFLEQMYERWFERTVSAKELKEKGL